MTFIIRMKFFIKWSIRKTMKEVNKKALFKK